MKKTPTKSGAPTLSEIRRAVKAIKPEQLYTPYEIANNGLILNTRFEKSYRHVYRLIQYKKLPAINLNGVDTKPRYMVKGADLKAFLVKQWQL